MDRRTVLKLSAAGSGWVVLSSCSDGDDGDGGAGDGPDGDGSTAATVPQPSALVRTRWAQDPLALGSYSFLPVGADPELRRALAEPVGGRLHFAGEATSSEAPSTVHGAIGSGERVAGSVLAAASPGDSVVVVGAGAAGITAARLLADEGLQVVVLEAADRVGGRLHTVQPEGWPIPVELGASWVHDVTASDLPALLDGAEVATVPFDYSLAVLGQDGEPVDDPEALFAPAVETVGLAVAWAEEQDTDRSLAEAIDQSGAVGATDVDPAALQAYLSGAITTEFAASPEQLSAWWGMSEGSEGDDLLVTGGYDTLVTDAADGLDVRLGAVVAEIAVTEDEVVVTTAGGERVAARHAVVTVPLGVLRAGSIAFRPELPEPHRAAIERLGMGLLDKYWFRFDEQFWDDDALVWARVTPDDTPFSEWFNLAPVTGEPVLMALMGGPLAREWEDRSDEQVVAAAVVALQEFLNARW